MLAIKLQRIGKKHQPSYRLVVAPKRSKLGAPPIEDLGSYNPFSKKATFDGAKIKHWIEVGAKPTVTAHNLLVNHKVLEGKKITVKLGKTKKDGGKTPAEGPKPAETVAAS